jgi:uncharacterized membrane protein SpoIIM required for sporulation
MSTIDLERFIARRREGWLELDKRLAHTSAGGRIRTASTRDLERLGSLYRRAALDLALARRDYPDEPVTQYLNDLVARAHPVLYRGEPVRAGAIASYMRFGIPRAFRRASGYVLASLALTLAGALAGYAAVVLRPDLSSSLAPQNSLFDRMARGEVPVGTDVGLATAVGIILNNMRVAVVVFAGGILLGIPTALLLMFNGWTVGTLAAVEHRDGLDVTFWSFIAPHGIIELSIFVFAGATGLMLADALLRPGLLRRFDALVAVIPTALYLALGLACLLISCGLIEGLFSPTGAPEVLKYAVGAAGGIALYSWLLLTGRQRSAPAPISLDANPNSGVGLRRAPAPRH